MRTDREEGKDPLLLRSLHLLFSLILRQYHVLRGTELRGLVIHFVALSTTQRCLC